MNPDRIDFTILPNQVIVTKLRRDLSDLTAPRDIPVGSETKPVDFNLSVALDWCEQNGYVVRRWEGGARAWKGEIWVIRTRSQIIRRRRQAEQRAAFAPPSTAATLSLNFAFDG